jgi:hypothetical protein
MDTMSLIVHLPQYTQLDDDYSGAARLMDMIASLYGLPTESEYYEKAGQQMEEVNQALNKNPQLKSIVRDMEAQYGDHPHRKPEERRPPLSPEVEKFLSEMERRLGDEGKA